MKILIRDGDWWLGEQLSSTLKSASHTIQSVPSTADIGHDEATDELVEGSDALVVFGYSNGSDNASELIDHSTRQLYNLLHSADRKSVV